MARLFHFWELVHFVKVAKKCKKVAQLCHSWDLVYCGKLATKVARLCHFWELVHFVKVAKKCQKVAQLCHFWDLVHCSNLAKKWKVWWPKIVKKWHVCSAFGNLRTVSRWQKSGTLVPHLGTCTLCQIGQKVSKVARLCHFCDLVHCGNLAKEWKVWWPKSVQKWHFCATFGNLRIVSKLPKIGLF